MESIANLHSEHARIGKVRTTKRVASIQHIPLIGDVGASETHRKVFAEVFSEGEVKRVVAGQVAGAIATEEARPVVDGERAKAAPGQIAFHTGGKRVALIVVQEKVAFFGWSEIRQASCDGANAFRSLIRVDEMSAIVPKEKRRTHGGFEPLDDGALNGEREEDIGIAEGIVVEIIFRRGMKVSFAEGPTADGNGDAVLLLDVAFAIERQEDAIVATGIVDKASGDGVQRRSLIIVGISGAQDPIELGNLDGGADAGIGGVLADLAGKVCIAQATAQRKPGKRLELIFKEESFQVSGGLHALAEESPRAIVGVN